MFTGIDIEKVGSEALFLTWPSHCGCPEKMEVSDTPKIKVSGPFLPSVLPDNNSGPIHI